MELANLQVASVKPARSESGLSVQSVGGGADRKKTPFNELLNTKVDLSRKPNAVAGSKVDLIEERKGNDAGNGLKKPLKEKPTKKQAETSLSNQTSAKGEEETKAKGWGASWFGSSKKKKVDEDFEIFEDGDGNDVKMKIHGALEVGGEEYAIMSYADEVDTTEYEIMKIDRAKDDTVSYSAVEDEELYQDLSEAAIEHLETKFIFS